MKTAVMVGKVKPTDKVLCGGCYKVSFKRREGTPNRNGVLHCPGCAKLLPRGRGRPRKDGPPVGKRKRDGMLWYVLQCFPGKEKECRASINRKVRIEGLEGKLGRIVIPTQLVETVKPTYQELAKEDCDNPRVGKFQADRKLAEILDCDLSKIHEHAGYRTRTYLDMSTKKWSWKVQKLTGTKHQTVRQVKTPGYMLVEMHYDPALHQVIRNARQSWDFLIRPIDFDTHTLAVKFNKRRGGWFFSLRTRTGGQKVELDVKTGPFRTEGECQTAGGKAKLDLERFVPTPVAQSEAKAMVEAEKAVRDIVKDRVEKNRVHVNVRVGDSAVVIEGLWRNTAGVVTKIDKSDPTQPIVTMRCRVIGQEMNVTVPAWEVKRG